VGLRSFWFESIHIFKLILMGRLLMFMWILSHSFAVFGQSGWGRDKGTYFTKLDVASFNSRSYYNADGVKLNTNKFMQSAVNFYGEYGITDHFNFILNAPLLKSNSFESTTRVLGLGDPHVELKFKPTGRMQLPIAVSIGADLPLGRSNVYATNKVDAREKINLPTGDGELNFWGTLGLSLPFSHNIYTSWFVAYNDRQKYNGLEFKDQVVYGGEIGASFVKNMWMNFKIKSQKSTAPSAHPELSFIRGDGTNFTQISGEVYYKISDKIGATFTILGYNDWLTPLKNIYASPFVSVGFVYEKKENTKNNE
jgi:hypothetical protein